MSGLALATTLSISLLCSASAIKDMRGWLPEQPQIRRSGSWAVSESVLTCHLILATKILKNIKRGLDSRCGVSEKRAPTYTPRMIASEVGGARLVHRSRYGCHYGRESARFVP